MQLPYQTERKLLPSRRRSEVTKIIHNTSTFFVSVSFFEDGSVGEVFIDCSKEGSEFREIMNSFAMMISLALQHGAGLKLILKILGQYHEDELPKKIANILYTYVAAPQVVLEGKEREEKLDQYNQQLTEQKKPRIAMRGVKPIKGQH